MTSKKTTRKSQENEIQIMDKKIKESEFLFDEKILKKFKFTSYQYGLEVC